ncbi:hypothetical protein PAT3040_06143 [Paenibacillus agaridevorans]|uniref:Uncharacterized protein n=1 Tax=Paenibacillus agaridevorans TaxID=171404 RepID=A0A2R5EXA5_9BACL|nr:hypothetical protein [Paenibacillus agaridevorans]GBG11342.1 hypothetical protein PAT3040_06143 [Paenibacillus agaridevorans]
MTKTTAKEEPRFTKAQLLRGRGWSSREREQLAALLKDEESYTVQQAKRLNQTFTNRRVE